jgi:hypothetical protein
LVITRGDEPEITVDNIEVAQFIYLMLKNQKVRDVIGHHYLQGGPDPGSLHTGAETRPRGSAKGIAAA